MMNRMDRYDTKTDNNDEVVMSREQKNQDMYKDVYLNNSSIDYEDIISDTEEKEIDTTIDETEIEEKVEYVEKTYDINDYLLKAHERRIDDKKLRSLDDTDCDVNRIKAQEDEISRLINNIEEKENEEDFFSELMPEDENTIVTDPVECDTLNNVIGEETIVRMDIEDTIDKTFQNIINDERKISKRKKNKKLPLIIFFITLFLLIVVILLIFII